MKLANPFGMMVCLAAFVAKEGEACETRSRPKADVIPQDNAAEELTKIRTDAGLTQKATVIPTGWWGALNFLRPFASTLGYLNKPSKDLLESVTKAARGSCEKALDHRANLLGTGDFKTRTQDFVENVATAKEAMDQWAKDYEDNHCAQQQIPDGICAPYLWMMKKVLTNVECVQVNCDPEAGLIQDKHRVVCQFGMTAKPVENEDVVEFQMPGPE